MCADVIVALQWELLFPGDLSAGIHANRCPVKRYGASMVIDRAQREIVLLYGYMYDHLRRRPTWLDDVWTYSLETPRVWKLRQKATLAGFEASIQPTDGSDTRPSPRYKMACAIMSASVNGTEIIFMGGDDGGATAQP